MASSHSALQGVWDKIEQDSEQQADSLWTVEEPVEQSLSDQPPKSLSEYYSSNDEVWISIDIECHCQNQTFAEHKAGTHNTARRICEIGLCTLDTRDIAAIDGGDRGVNFHKYLNFTELAFTDIKHNKSKCRLSWCKIGDAEDFLYGNTTWMHSRKRKEFFLDKVTSLLEPDRVGLAGDLSPGRDDKAKLRKAIFLVFDGVNDMKWLRQAGISLETEFPNSQIVNLQRLRVATTVGDNIGKPRGKCTAQELMDGLGIPCSGLHNGGNDAAGQMQAFIASLFVTEDQLHRVFDECGVQPWLPRLREAEHVSARKESSRTLGVGRTKKPSTQSTPTVGDVASFPSLVSAMSRVSVKDGKKEQVVDEGEGMPLRADTEGPGGKDNKGGKRQSRRRNRLTLALDHSAFQ